MRKVLAVLASAMVVTACGDSGTADADGDGVITQEEVVAEAQSGGAMAMRPGKWEQTTTFTDITADGVPEEMRGMIEQQMGTSFTTSMCLTEEQINKPDAEFFGGENQSDCSYDAFDRNGNRMTLAMTCGGAGGQAKMQMDGEFDEESMSMDIETQISAGPMGEISMKGAIAGKRVGDCDS